MKLVLAGSRDCFERFRYEMWMKDKNTNDYRYVGNIGDIRGFARDTKIVRLGSFRDHPRHDEIWEAVQERFDIPESRVGQLVDRNGSRLGNVTWNTSSWFQSGEIISGTSLGNPGLFRPNGQQRQLFGINPRRGYIEYDHSQGRDVDFMPLGRSPMEDLHQDRITAIYDEILRPSLTEDSRITTISTPSSTDSLWDFNGLEEQINRAHMDSMIYGTGVMQITGEDND